VGLLDDLAKKYGSDKSSLFHAYTEHYERWFGPIRFNVLAVLELGVANGASLRMWKDFFPVAHVQGLDNDPRFMFSEERITTVLGDQMHPGVADGFASMDIIIDDGGHQMEQQKASFWLYFPKLKPGGLYVIEDLHTSYWPNYGGVPFGDESRTTVGLLRSFVDAVNLRGAEEYPGRRGGAMAPEWQAPPIERDIASIEFARSICCIRKRR
jgi:hypothetical protein